MIILSILYLIVSGRKIDQNLIYLIESVVIDWTHQVDAFLRKDSSQPIIEGLNPGPMVEIEFWQTRASNLEDIYKQVWLLDNYLNFEI